MRLAVLVPTRGRAKSAALAIMTFLDALQVAEPAADVVLVVSDDSDDAAHRRELRSLVHDVCTARPHVIVEIVGAEERLPREASVKCPGKGPGAARNRGLRRLRQLAADADATILFDDDVVFTGTAYRGHPLACDGPALIAGALRAISGGHTIAGCGYSGRQDLSMLEHARLEEEQLAGECLIVPAVDRGCVENVAPGGISTAFLAISLGPAQLPCFPEHYNEDYVWLHAFARAGWNLRRLPTPLVHAPPGDVSISAPALSFEVHGEIVWLAVLEHERFPARESVGLAAAVDEIARDLRAALNQPSVAQRPATARTVREVLDHYEQVGSEIRRGQPGPHAVRLLADIESGLSIRPAAAADRPKQGPHRGTALGASSER